MIEEWRNIEGFVGYQVSDLGHVRSVDRITVSTDGRKMKFAGRIRRLHYKRKNGKIVRTSVTIRGRCHLVHHLVLKAFVGRMPIGMEGCHDDGNAANNAKGNLRWDNREGNVADVYRHGVRKRDWSGGHIRRLGGRAFVSGYICGIAGLL